MLFVENKEQFKQYIKIAITRIVGILIPLIILLIYLILTESISDFINYAILGITTFSNKISYLGLLHSDKISIKIFAILMPVSIILMITTLIIKKILKKDDDESSKILTILIYSFSIIIVMYPISDEIHFLIGSLITIIGLIYLINLLLKKIYNKIEFSKKYKIFKISEIIIWSILFAIILTTSICNLYKYIKTEKNSQIRHFKNIEIGQYLKNRIEEIDQFILEKEQEGQKVYILDSEAVVYMIPLDKYNKDYDMFLKGNVGKDGEKGQIEKLKQKNDNNTLILIRNSKLSLNWQTPVEVIDYIRKNLELVEEISIYEVYK